MKAVAYKTPGSIDRENALQDITLERPKAEGSDLLVKIIAVSVNPADTKLRMGKPPEDGEWGILGFDASGIVEAVGSEVQNFKPGDAVFYAGSIARPGTNSEYHLVDERIVESWVKQIDARLQVTGAQWDEETLPQMLKLRSSYLNHQLDYFSSVSG